MERYSSAHQRRFRSNWARNGLVDRGLCGGHIQAWCLTYSLAPSLANFIPTLLRTFITTRLSSHPRPPCICVLELRWGLFVSAHHSHNPESSTSGTLRTRPFKTPCTTQKPTRYESLCSFVCVSTLSLKPSALSMGIPQWTRGWVALFKLPVQT